MPEVLAQIRDQHRLSLGSDGRPRMTEELNELGLQVGQPLPGSGLRANRERGRVGRLMRQNGVQVVRTRKFKATTDSEQAFNIAPNLLQQDLTASGPNQKCPLMVCRQTIAGQRNTSTASTTRVVGIQHWAGKAPWPSNERPPNMRT